MEFWLVVGVLFVIWVVHEATAEKRARKRLGKEYEGYAAGAFEPQREEGPNGSVIVTRLASEVVSSGGRSAVLLDAPRRPDGRPKSTVVHEVNKNGSFSKKGPYFISWRKRNWSTTGRKHLIKVLRPPKGKAFEAANPGGGSVPEIGLQVVEWNTDKYDAVPARRYEFRSGVAREG